MNQSSMLLSKNSFQFLLTVFIIFSNFWIYKIFNLNFLVGVVVLIVSLIIVSKPENIKLLILCALVLISLQIQTTHIKDLALLNNDDQRVQAERIRSYPLTYIKIFSKVLWLKPEVWVEQNKTIIALSRIEKNLFESLDTNQYFFAGFPRNNNSDFQKFSFIFLPFFIVGIFELLKQKQTKMLILFFLIPVILLAFIGDDNQLGPFILFPFFIVSVFAGLKLFLGKIKQ